MNEPKLSHRQLVLIRRAAEDAIHACNRHYGPFVDVVAHPLNICALVDMAQESISYKAKVEAVKKLIEGYHQHSYREADDFVSYLEKALKEGVA
ncbi:hypothetical protein Asch02_02221 [Acinetobacter schindleri]